MSSSSPLPVVWPGRERPGHGGYPDCRRQPLLRAPSGRTLASPLRLRPVLKVSDVVRFNVKRSVVGTRPVRRTWPQRERMTNRRVGLDHRLAVTHSRRVERRELLDPPETPRLGRQSWNWRRGLQSSQPAFVRAKTIAGATIIRGMGSAAARPLARTIRVGGPRVTTFHARIWLPPSTCRTAHTCPIEGDPEPTDRNVPSLSTSGSGPSSLRDGCRRQMDRERGTALGRVAA